MTTAIEVRLPVQAGGRPPAVLSPEQEQWLRYAHDHLGEILRDAIRWQQHVRQQQAEDDWMSGDPLDWYMDTFAEARIEARKLLPAISAMKTARAVRDARAKPGPVHQLKATPGWPPIAIPGQPGRYLTLTSETSE